MAYWSEIVGGKVKRTVRHEGDPAPHFGGIWVDVSAVNPRPGPGFDYDGSTFTPPVPGPAPAGRTIIPTEDFIRRFTPDEFKAVMVAAKTNDDVLALEKKLLYLSTVNLLAPELDAALSLLQQGGQLTPARKIEILTP
jgi:hypothetical protein